MPDVDGIDFIEFLVLLRQMLLQLQGSGGLPTSASGVSIPPAAAAAQAASRTSVENLINWINNYSL